MERGRYTPAPGVEINPSEFGSGRYGVYTDKEGNELAAAVIDETGKVLHFIGDNPYAAGKLGRQLAGSGVKVPWGNLSPDSARLIENFMRRNSLRTPEELDRFLMRTTRAK